MTSGSSDAAGAAVAVPPDSSAPLPAGEVGRRFVFVDGLRGIAALTVLLYHIWLIPSQKLTSASGHLLFAIVRRGGLGVQVFFVLSGFVIAHSLRNVVITPRVFWRFAFRRSVRLDPPYWVSIFLVVASLVASNALIQTTPLPVPHLSEIVAEMFYVQRFVGVQHFLPVYWTLCLEIQLYLVFVVLLALFQRLSRRFGGTRTFVIVFGPAILMSIAARQRFLAHGIELHTWFLPYWHEFFLGVVVAFIIRGTLRSAWLFVFSGIVLAQLASSPEPEPIAVVCFAFLLLFAAKRRRLTVWLGSTPMQFLGQVSYSIYLLHMLIAPRVNSVLLRIAPNVLQQHAFVTGCLGIVATISMAWVLNRSVEQPFHSLSRRIKL